MPSFTGSVVSCCCWPPVMTLTLRPTERSRLRLKPRRPRERSCPSFASLARARLQAACGNRQQARDILTPIYRWFSEGLETHDLAEARALLVDLQ